MTRADLRYVARARAAGAKYAWRIVKYAREQDIPLSWAFALVEQEAFFRNIFGHDRGSILHGLPVTKPRVNQLLAHVARGGVSNGVGLTQLTWPPLIRKANTHGSVHKAGTQLRYGFNFFREVTQGDFAHKAWRYNGSTAYQAQIATRQRRWHKILTGKAR